MRMLVCYDGSDASRRALQLAGQDAKRFEAAIEVVKVITRDEQDDPIQLAREEERLQQEARFELEDYGIPWTTRLYLSYLSPAEQILQHIEDIEVNRIYIGVQKKSKLDKLFFGSTAQQIILQATCPVVAVK